MPRSLAIRLIQLRKSHQMTAEYYADPETAHYTDTQLCNSCGEPIALRPMGKANFHEMAAEACQEALDEIRRLKEEAS